MSGLEDFIKQLISEAKLSAKSAFEDKVYRDEPIITTASKLKTYMPEKYTEMKKIGFESTAYLSIPTIFLKQARFMEHFEDDYDGKCPFTCYWPTYRVMNDEQLRVYFSWRTKIRRGIFEEVSLSYAFVYIYELLSCVGAESPEDALEKLQAFNEGFAPFDGSVTSYIKKWSTDFTVYYNLPPDKLAESPEGKSNAAIIVLKDGTSDDDALFDALCILSSHDFFRSKLYKERPEETKNIVCRVWREYTAYCKKKMQRSPAERFFGVVSWQPYNVFDGAVFSDTGKKDDFIYTVNENFRFRRLNGRWYRYSYFPLAAKNRQLGAMMKFIDSRLREKYGVSPLKAEGTKILASVIDDAYTEYQKELEDAKRLEVKVDFSVLEGIRCASVKTRESLLTDEERGLDSAEKESVDVIGTVTSDNEECSPGININKAEIGENTVASLLTECEKAIIKSILESGDAEKTAKDFGKLLSVEVESINEKLFDVFSDNVIWFDGDTPAVEEDYEEEVKGVLQL